jgi:hypothetical protein
MRCTQLVGLKEEARKFIKDNFVTSECHDESGSSGMFDDGPNLYAYNLGEQGEWKEVVQCAPWSSGPVIFLCLENRFSGERIFQYSQEEIDELI